MAANAAPSPTSKALAPRVAAALEEQIPQPRCELDHKNGFELLIATILAAQSTDRGVNKVTPILFGRYPDAHALAAASRADVEEIVHPTGFFRSKARAIQETSAELVLRHGGEVPTTMAALCGLRGVARKTANVVLGTAYGIAEGVIVDVHGTRVSQRLGLTTHKEPAKIEADLMTLFPKASWIALGHRLTLHGRYTCLARKPACTQCACEPFCPTAKALMQAADAGVVSIRKEPGRGNSDIVLAPSRRSAPRQGTRKMRAPAKKKASKARKPSR